MLDEVKEYEEIEDPSPKANHYIVTVNREEGIVDVIDIWADEVECSFGRLYFYRLVDQGPGLFGRKPAPKRTVVAAFAQWESFLLETDTVYGGIDPRDIPKS